MGRGNESLIGKSGSHVQDGHHAQYMEKTQQPLCPVTVVDSQVSDRFPWATCYVLLLNVLLFATSVPLYIFSGHLLGNNCSLAF